MCDKPVFCKFNKVWHPDVRKYGLERDLVFLLFCFVRYCSVFSVILGSLKSLFADPLIDGNLYFELFLLLPVLAFSSIQLKNQ